MNVNTDSKQSTESQVEIEDMSPNMNQRGNMGSQGSDMIELASVSNLRIYLKSSDYYHTLCGKVRRIIL